MSVRESLHISIYSFSNLTAAFIHFCFFLSSLIIHHENIWTLVILLSCARTVLFIRCILITHWQTLLDVIPTAHALIFDLTHVFDWSVIIIGLLYMSIKRDAVNLSSASPRHTTAHYHILVILISCGWVSLLSSTFFLFLYFYPTFIVYN